MSNLKNLSQLIEYLENYLDPVLNLPWKTMKIVPKVECLAEAVNISLVLPYPAATIQAEMVATLSRQLQDMGVSSVNIQLSWEIVSRVSQGSVPGIAGVKNVIAVASGKGGVGKSTTAVNLALALQREGARVGLLDADIYGPNQPQMLGINQLLKPENGQALTPVVAHGLQSMSMGYLIEANMPMVWRGPMVSSALQQLALSTHWDNLDYLIIDLPPGTGDIQLTLSQKIPVAGAVIVTTPQDVALLDARKGLEMFRKVNVPVLGVIENMSYHVCSHCGHEEAIFGSAGGERLAASCDMELLGSVPLVSKIREQADKGVPIVCAAPEHPVAQAYQAIARRVTAKLALQPRSFNSKFPKVVVETTAI